MWLVRTTSPLRPLLSPESSSVPLLASKKPPVPVMFAEISSS